MKDKSRHTRNTGMDNNGDAKGKPDSKTEIGQDIGFPIVGIGASAGGLEAFQKFFESLAPDSGMAFVLVSHLDPTRASMLTEILQRTTKMTIAEVTDQIVVGPDHIYVIPPNRDMTISQGRLHLSVPEVPRGQRMPIDSFFRSLADEQGENAICMIFSGSGTDGTFGLRAIHGAGGVSFVQDPSTAQYDGMPSNAVKSGLVSYVLPVEKIPERLIEYTKTLSMKKGEPIGSIPATTIGLEKVMHLLHLRTGYDFSLYKRSSVGRRIERRMILHKIADIDMYARYLKEHPEEIQSLFEELLINVTSFFRDPEAFAVLKKDILTQMFRNKQEYHTFRIWVPGCATGEEAYSIAMIFKEYMDDVKEEFTVQLYATDIDEAAIAAARSGSYPPNIGADVTPERLRRFFVKEETGCRVSKEIRSMIVFAIQNAIKDPPFTRLDMISCRNLLIYLEPEAQNRIISTFHYSLKPGGVLLLGPSEAIGSQPELFEVINRQWKFYQAKRSDTSVRTVTRGDHFWTGGAKGKRTDEAAKKSRETSLAELTQKVLLHAYAPASVITDEKGNILYIHGDTGKYLRPAQGQPSLNVIEMAREGLQLELRKAIQNAAVKETPMVCNDLSVKTDGGLLQVNLTVRPLTDPEAIRGSLIISFQEIPSSPAQNKPVGARRATDSAKARRVDEVEQELLYTKESLNTTIEELQAVNEELTSMNEEHQSTNEELQSTNEELQTSEEEIQSINEELVTVNAELQAKIELLNAMQDDMNNLLESTSIGTIFLDKHLAIRKFTKKAAEVYRVVASDIGRPLSDINSNIRGHDLVHDAQSVIDSLAPCEKEVQTVDQMWYLARILPYMTYDNIFDGAVMTFIDISELKETEALVQESEERFHTIVDYSYDWETWVRRQNDLEYNSPASLRISGYQPEEFAADTGLMERIVHADDKEIYKLHMIKHAEAGSPGDHDTVQFRIVNRSGETRWIEHICRTIHSPEGQFLGWRASNRDITERKLADEALQETREYAQSIVDTIRDPLIVMDGDLKVISANRSFCSVFRVTPQESVGRYIYELGEGQWNIPKLRELLETILPQNTHFDHFELEHDFPAIGHRKLMLNARRITRKTVQTESILLSIEDVTERVTTKK